MTNAIQIQVDLDQLDFESRDSHQLVQINFVKGGKRVTVHIRLDQYDRDKHPKLRLSVVNRRTVVTCKARVLPWVDDKGFIYPHDHEFPEPKRVCHHVCDLRCHGALGHHDWPGPKDNTVPCTCKELCT